MLSSYAVYHARDWAEGRSAEEIRAEIAECDRPRDFTWHKAGNAHQMYTRVVVLREILAGLNT